MTYKGILFSTIAVTAVAITAVSSIHIRNNEHAKAIAQHEAKLHILQKELDKAKSDRTALKQNYCYTKDVKISKLNVVSLKLDDGQFIRGHHLFKDLNPDLKIQKFSKPVIYLCALGAYNLSSMYFFPDHNYYILDADSSKTKEISVNLSRHKQIAQLPFRSNDTHLGE